jgi:hypothetical protein
MELPDESRGGEAIPGAITEILRLIEDGRSLEDTRKQGILDIGERRIDGPYRRSMMRAQYRVLTPRFQPTIRVSLTTSQVLRRPPEVT